MKTKKVNLYLDDIKCSYMKEHDGKLCLSIECINCKRHKLCSSYIKEMNSRKFRMFISKLQPKQSTKQVNKKVKMVTSGEVNFSYFINNCIYIERTEEINSSEILKQEYQYRERISLMKMKSKYNKRRLLEKMSGKDIPSLSIENKTKKKTKDLTKYEACEVVLTI